MRRGNRSVLFLLGNIRLVKLVRVSGLHVTNRTVVFKLFKTRFSGINHHVSVGNVNCHNTVDNRGGGDKVGVTPQKM